MCVYLESRQTHCRGCVKVMRVNIACGRKYTESARRLRLCVCSQRDYCIEKPVPPCEGSLISVNTIPVLTHRMQNKINKPNVIFVYHCPRTLLSKELVPCPLRNSDRLLEFSDDFMMVKNVHTHLRTLPHSISSCPVPWINVETSPPCQLCHLQASSSGRRKRSASFSFLA